MSLLARFLITFSAILMPVFGFSTSGSGPIIDAATAVVAQNEPKDAGGEPPESGSKDQQLTDRIQQLEERLDDLEEAEPWWWTGIISVVLASILSYLLSRKAAKNDRDNARRERRFRSVEFPKLQDSLRESFDKHGREIEQLEGVVENVMNSPLRHPIDSLQLDEVSAFSDQQLFDALDPIKVDSYKTNFPVDGQEHTRFLEIAVNDHLNHVTEIAKNLKKFKEYLRPLFDQLPADEIYEQVLKKYGASGREDLKKSNAYQNDLSATVDTLKDNVRKSRELIKLAEKRLNEVDRVVRCS